MLVSIEGANIIKDENIIDNVKFKYYGKHKSCAYECSLIEKILDFSSKVEKLLSKAI